MADKTADPDQDLPEKPDHFVNPGAAFINLFAHADRHTFPDRWTLRAGIPARINSAHGVQQPLGRCACAGDISIMFARHPTHHPSANRVDFIHAGQINPADRAGKAGKFAFKRGDGGQRQLP